MQWKERLAEISSSMVMEKEKEKEKEQQSFNKKVRAYKRARERYRCN